MRFLKDYPVFRSGCFYDREWHIKAKISRDGHIRKIYDGTVVGFVRSGKIYDRTLNYLGYFDNGTLYTIGGRTWGFCYSWELNF